MEESSAPSRSFNFQDYGWVSVENREVLKMKIPRQLATRYLHFTLQILE